MVNGQIIRQQGLVHPTNPGAFYLTSINGIHRSGDAGASWPLSKAAPPITNENGMRIGRATDLMMHPSNPNILYAGIAGDGIYKTVDGGVGGWVKLTAGLPGDFSQVTAITLALARNQPATLYAALSGPAGFPRFSLYRTTNAGSNWSQRFMYDSSDNPPFNDYIGVHPTNTDIVYITGRFFYRSEDGGLNFDREDEPKRPHDDHHAFAQHPTDPKIIYTASDGGIYRSSDTGKRGSWSFIGEGIANVEFFDIADTATEPNLLIGGTQDNAVVHYDGTSTIWSFMDAGLAILDEGAVDFDPTNAQRFYAVAEGINDLSVTKIRGTP